MDDTQMDGQNPPEDIKKKKEEIIKSPLKDSMEQTVLNYVDKSNSKTYLNQVQAYMAAHPKQTNYDSARVQSSRLFAKRNVRAEIDRLLRQNRAGIQERISAIASVLHGTHQRKVVTVDGNGKVSTQTYNPSAQDILKAAQELNRLEGTAEKVKMELEAESEMLRDIRKAYLPDILESVKHVRIVTPDKGEVLKDGKVEGGLGPLAQDEFNPSEMAEGENQIEEFEDENKE